MSRLAVKVEGGPSPVFDADRARRARARLRRGLPDRDPVKILLLPSPPEPVEDLIAIATAARSEIMLKTPPDPVAECAKTSGRPPMVADIVSAVARCAHMSRAEIMSPRRNKDIVHARHVVMHLARVLTTRSLPEIGRRLGGRDHSTVLHGCRKVAGDPDKYRSLISMACRELQTQGFYVEYEAC